MCEGRFGRVIVTTKDGNENMIRPEVFRELRILDQIIQNTTAHFDDESFSYEKVCARWENECFTNDILNLDYIMDEVKINVITLIKLHGIYTLSSFDVCIILYTYTDTLWRN